MTIIKVISDLYSDDEDSTGSAIDKEFEGKLNKRINSLEKKFGPCVSLSVCEHEIHTGRYMPVAVAVFRKLR